jgi:hypothetical protein
MIKEMHYIFTSTTAPVQAEGTIEGSAFYFRSRHDHWSFAVSDDSNIDPIDIGSPEEGAAHGFFIERRYAGGPAGAGQMPLEEAERIIDDCARQYLNERARKSVETTV